MILAVFIIVSITSFSGGDVSLSLEGHSADNICNFGPDSGSGPVTVTVPAAATKAQIQAAAKTALEAAPCFITFGTGDSVRQIP